MAQRSTLVARLQAWDQAIFDGVAARRSPTGDRPLRRLTGLADHSVLWLAIAAGLSRLDNRRLGRAGRRGLAAIALSSFVANQLAKRAVSRARPVRTAVPLARLAHRIPTSSSFPSGHAASAAAFATAASRTAPVLTAPLGGLAALVGFSRVHAGVHYPGDVLAGVVLGVGMGLVTDAVLPTYEIVDVTPTIDRVAGRPDGRGVVAVINPESGGGRGADLADLLEKELTAADVRRLPDGADLVAALRDAARDAEVIAVAGGDGSVNAGATVALEAGLPLFVVAGGTLNHFAGDAGLGNVDTSLTALREGTTTRVDVGVVEADGYREIFLNTLSFGSYPAFVERRERWEKRVGKPLAAAYAVWRVLRSEEPVVADVDGVRRRLALIFVGAGSYEPRRFVPRLRPRLDSGELDLRFFDSGPRYAGARLALAVATGMVSRTGVFVARRGPSFEISREEAGQIARDGEVGDAPKDFTVRVDPRALTVYVPAP
jgi:diacylglycerol kinase family enzyme/membrane-associated phospholipid phosphatase